MAVGGRSSIAREERKPASSIRFPSQGRSSRPGLVAYDQGRIAAAELGEGYEDLVADARAEMAAGPMGRVSPLIRALAVRRRKPHRSGVK
ncbi:DUF5132 domain-containing protein [Sinorhizobium sp. 7-81]|uniref:DUF5132 domain-containing protein n=1 Tax=Sinorhizobium sp. 8-89 TaxID=3049089 RepID=UPI0024C2B8BF|nr:DUF5132 domain-containing protein [Sinorhizobium sp. 8-89]MDK1493177.1 DUF5132 domain-containing protein [Sinorhizobium sp. 8-89]